MTVNQKMRLFVDNSYPVLVQTLIKLLNEAELPVKKTYALKIFFEKLVAEAKRFEEIRMESLKKLGKKDKDGNLSTDDNGEVLFKNKEDKEKFTKSFVELIELDLTLEVPDLTLDDLGEVKLKGNELLALQVIFSGLNPPKEEEKKETESKTTSN